MDQLVVGAAVLGAAVGLWQGALKQIANTVGVVAGLMLAVMFHRQCAALVAQWTDTSGGTAQTIAFLAIVLLVPLALGIAASLLTALFKVVHINFLNRLLGAAIGAICYGLLAFIARYMAEQWATLNV